MPRRPSLRVASLLLALLAVTAGCASLSGDTTTARTDTVGTDDDVPPTDTSEPTTGDAGTDSTTEGAGDDSTTGGAGDDSTTGDARNDSTGDDTTVRAALVGTTVTGLDVSATDAEREAALADALDVPARSVRFRADRGVLEVYDTDVSGQAIRDALARQGFDASDARVRQGVTDATQAEVVRTLAARLGVLGIDATVEAATVDGRRGVAIDPADGNRSRIRDAVGDRGRVEIVAHFPAEGGDGTFRDVTLLTNGDFANVGAVQTGRPTPSVPVTVTADAAANFSATLVAFGFTGEGVANCPTDAAMADPANASGYCLYTVHDGDVVYAAGMSAGLADTIESGEWEADPRFVMTAANESDARELRAHLQAGALPTRLAFVD